MRRRFSKRARPKEDMSLQITSMADVFTIILVFLLKSFSTSISGLTVNQVTLPEVTAAAQTTDSLKVEVGQNSIQIDGKTVTQMEDFHFEKTDVERDGTPRSLNMALIEQMKKQKEKGSDERAPSSVSPETLLVLADKQAPYAVLKMVLASASNAGFSDFRLIVVEDQ